jgi:uncharacterized protein (DUF362 family)
MEQEQKELWALVELFGHQRVAGKVIEAEIGGGHLIRIEIPAVKGREPMTKYYNVKAVYGITPVDEATARRMAEDINPAPVNEWSMDREIDRRKRLSGPPSDDDGGDDLGLDN